MKQILFLILIYGINANAFAQTDSEPCCNVISIDALKNSVAVRDKTTGRLYQFKADAMDMKAISKGDAVSIAGGKITSINGATRTYATVRPDYSEPCCNVVSVQVDESEPCCNAVTIKNNATGRNSQITVPRAIASTIKTGQAVSVDGVTNLVVIQSSYGNSNGGTSAYGYAASSGEGSNDANTASPGEGTNASGTSSEKWVITPNNLKGATGRILMDNPEGSIWTVYIYTMTDSKYVTSFAEVNNKGLFTLTPGEYKITINNAPVQNVPVKKGHDTKLKCGTLNIASETDWSLYDETGKTYYTAGTKPAKMPLPVGTYILKLGGQDQAVIIKHGETVEM